MSVALDETGAMGMLGCIAVSCLVAFLDENFALHVKCIVLTEIPLNEIMYTNVD